MVVEKEQVVFFRALSDERDYRKIVLRNSLQVLLISDPHTNQCAACMNVGVGSFSDPADLEGLAHFLEHMLFFASEKYPVENSYAEFIAEHGGSRNACTYFCHTNYYFAVNKGAFQEALDRFAQFFIKPLMPADAVSREVKAVESEYRKNLLVDGWRMKQLRKHLSSEDHPFHRFESGNLETLEVRPKKRGLDVRNELIKFYEENYSANLMRLAVYTNESLDKIQNLVEKIFSDIRNINRIIYRHPDQPFKSEHLQILVKTVPIQEGHKVRIVWPVTHATQHYEERPCSYAGHLIGHRGEGSIYYNLKTRGWATAVSAFQSDSDWDLGFSFFNVEIHLTGAGHDHMQEIIGLLFKYIQFLQESDVRKWIFDEISNFSRVKWHYQDQITPMTYVLGSALNMQLYPPHNWLLGSTVPRIFSPRVIKKVLNQLSPDSVRIFWESKKFEGETDKLEPWYGTAYSIESISSSTIEMWVHSASKEVLHLPAPNKFISTDISLETDKKMDLLPRVIYRSSYSILWHQFDTTLSFSKAFVKMALHCPYVGNSPETRVLSDIFSRLLTDYLDKYVSSAQAAGFGVNISNVKSGFEVCLFGYHDKLGILLEILVGEIRVFTVNKDRFLSIKEMITQRYQNIKYEQPYEQAFDYSQLILEDNSWSCPFIEGLEVLPDLQAEDLEKFVPMMLSKTFLELYIAGKIKSTEAKSMSSMVENTLFKCKNPPCKPLFPSQHLANRVVQLERGKNSFYSLRSLNPDNENSALVYHIQVGPNDFKMNVKIELFVLIAERPAFAQLRSVEQLGYVVKLMQRNNSGIRGIDFIIQSTVEDPRASEERVAAFLERFEEKLLHLSREEFKGHVQTLIEGKHCRRSLWDESIFHWQNIRDGHAMVDSRKSEVEALRKLTLPQFRTFFKQYIKAGPSRRTLSVRVYGNRHSSEFQAEAVRQDPAKIDNIFAFSKSQPLYGSSKGGFMAGMI